jgi:site-specific DNA-adenine methylase
MGSPVHRAVERAHEVIARHGRDTLEKTIWGSPAGKKRISERLVAMLPAHRTYTEPFAGSAAVLFAKEPAVVEAINDADEEIARAYKILQKLKPRDVERLRSMKWVGDESTFKGLIDAAPKDDVGWLHRFLYLTHFSYGKMRGKSFSPSVVGVTAKTVDRIEKFAPRLRRVKVYGGDYRKVVEKYDGKDTVHFLDPPYSGYNVDVGESAFDERAFFDVLKSLRGKFLITYGIRGELPKLVKNSDFEVRRIRTRRSISSMRGVGGPSVLTQLLISNYTPTRKSLDGLADGGWEIDEMPPKLVAGADLSSSGEIEKKRWSTAYINDLPDSAFLLVEDGGKKDADGRTTPRTLRHFPVRDADGKLDVAHVREAVGRIPQAKIAGFDADAKRALQNRARQLLDDAAREDAKKGGAAFEKPTRLLKGTDPGDERYVLGIVLEPEVVDAQGDIYSAEEIRAAAHRFMEDFGGLGLMHRVLVNDQVKVLECYLAPVDFELAGVAVRRGTWLLGVRVLSDELWAQVKDGGLTGFSIGGSARRVPEAAENASAPPPPTTEEALA